MPQVTLTPKPSSIQPYRQPGLATTLVVESSRAFWNCYYPHNCSPHRCVRVDLAELAVVAAHKVKAPAVEADALLEEAQPLNNVVLDLLLWWKQAVGV